MLRATDIKRKGTWDGIAVDTVVLGYDDRYRRRMAMTGTGGLGFVLDMASASVLADGDALVLTDGRLVAVKAAAEPLLEITCADPVHLARVAWHLGNRHLPTEIDGTRILIREDHVIADMVRGLGADVKRVDAPFTPEGGAYSGGGHHHHHHDDEDSDGHGHHHAGHHHG
ncbi:urease accessory protein UreE [Thalassospiraceae bacterium LMO-JJ14]|nr:urease accessory protein UreE [Thalassospiraceae bacterium LMO-JJ14]